MHVETNGGAQGPSARQPSSQTTALFKTDGGKTKSNALEAPSVSLPKGGGAIKGIDEKFSVNAVNGTASFSIPLPFSPARGASPALSLSYNSGSGNGVFGLGWNLSLPSIKRKTDKGLPKYLDNIDSDIFLFSEAEDLVPVFEKVYENPGDQIGAYQPTTKGDYKILEKYFPDKNGPLYIIRFYRPRIEGLFARIERWTEIESGMIKWRVITKDNVTTLFGWSKDSRIADPSDETRIYEWLPEFAFDDKGNCAHYIYKEEDEKNILAIDALHYKNRIRNDKTTYTNRYLSKVLYGNPTPYKNFDDDFPDLSQYFFETVFDYGNYNSQFQEVANSWHFRPDAFSDYKSGFEIRTTRLCERVLLFHHFDGPKEYNGLVKSLNFEYDTSTQKDFTFLKSVTAYGYVKSGTTYSQKNLPPTQFYYQQHEWNADVKNISTENLVHAPSGLDEPLYQFTDLYNEGLAGILTEQAGGWYYKHNLGNGQFENAQLVSPTPNFSGLGSQLHLGDLDANGGKQLINYTAEPKGYFELNDDNDWQPFKNFLSLPNVNFNDANTRMIDLNGDGKAEVLISEDNVFTWYQSAGKKGFKNINHSVKPFDEEVGPAVVFADDTQSVFLADMSGDGLSDIVRIRNGEVCYWPNLRYGKFGAKVGMDNAPVFDFPASFNPSFIKLADIDGSGTTDIIYLAKNKFSCWSNLSGNSFGTIPFEIEAVPDIHNLSKITVTDLLGNGVACIVWSSALPADVNAPLRYIDLMNSKKPYIMIGYKNNMGKEVSMEYKPSTYFYLEDKKAGNPWVTKLHFPVHCISRTETRDRISGYLFINEYKYHHGYYDHAEREFRGFGMVEQTDSEDFDRWKKQSGTNVLNEDKLNQLPVLSKTWTHTGAYLMNEKILDQFEHEYWFEGLKKFEDLKKTGLGVVNYEQRLQPARIVDENGDDIDQLSAHDWQEALRACKGMALRSEIFALDAKDLSVLELQKQLTPYSVATHNCIIQRLQPKAQNRHAVFIVKESEAMTYTYARSLFYWDWKREWESDTRIAHTINIRFNEFANVLESASVMYGRKNPNTALPKITQDAQSETYVTYSKSKFTNKINDCFEAGKPDAFRLPLPAEAKNYQLKNVAKTGTYYSIEDFKDIFNQAFSTEVGYHESSIPPEPNKSQRRLIEHIRTVYRSNNDLDLGLGLYELESLALPFESYQLAYTPELLNEIFNAKQIPAELAALMQQGKFVNCNGDANWWIQSGKMNFTDARETAANAQDRFYLPISYTDPFGSITNVEYEHHKLNIQKTTDALLNETTVTKFNYRTLSPQQMNDINDNLSEAITDELGLVKALAVMGKDKNGDSIGDEADDLDLLTEETNDQAIINDFFITTAANGVCDSVRLQLIARDLLKRATARFVYDFDVYAKTGKPAVVSSITREIHYRKDATTLNPESKLQLGFEYSNGLGKVIMKKVQAEPGRAKQLSVDANNQVTIIDPIPGTSPFLRWIGNGRTILNNKGNPVKQYEPFFSVSPKFEEEKELVETGVTPINYYDAINQLIRTEMPDDTFSKLTYTAWTQASYDANDTIQESDWYKKRTDSSRADYIQDVNEQNAADKASKHYYTPSQVYFDALGRAIMTLEHNTSLIDDVNEFRNMLFSTKLKFDIEGNLRAVVDARNNTVMEYKYDMLGNKVYEKSMDAGERWMMINILGQPLKSWDARGHVYQFEYNDPLHRLTDKIVTGIESVNTTLFTVEKIIYGENISDAKDRNLCGQVYKHYDASGVTQNERHDFAGNSLEVNKRLTNQYEALAIDWSVNPDEKLESEEFIKITEYDALNRMVNMHNWHSVTTTPGAYMPQYNERGILKSEQLQIGTEIKDAILSITYNEKGQRLSQQLGCYTTTQYTYDPQTFRLASLITSPPGGGNTFLQHLLYTYDPVGNITQIEDIAYQPVFFNNQKIEPKNEYTYDALYRLTDATGRENNTLN